MGAGGEAPPVKSEDVMILIGSSIILTMFFVQAWSIPVEIECEEVECETFEVKYDLSKGDEFTLEILEGEIRPTVILPDGSSDFGTNQDKEWDYTATTYGVHTFQINAVEESTIDYKISRGIIFDYGMYLIGILILGFGILKRITKEGSDEPMEALLED